MGFCDFGRSSRHFSWLGGSRCFVLEGLSDGSFQLDTVGNTDNCDWDAFGTDIISGSPSGNHRGHNRIPHNTKERSGTSKL